MEELFSSVAYEPSVRHDRGSMVEQSCSLYAARKQRTNQGQGLTIPFKVVYFLDPSMRFYLLQVHNFPLRLLRAFGRHLVQTIIPGL